MQRRIFRYSESATKNMAVRQKRQNIKSKYPSNRDLAERRSGRDPNEMRRILRRIKKSSKMIVNK